MTLRDRLPRVGARFLAGEVSAAVVARIVWHTGLVRGAGVWAALDAELAERASGWGVLSAAKLEAAIEFWVDKYDPDAVRRVRARVRGRSFTIGKRDDQAGTAAVYGSLSIADAAVWERRLAVMLAGVCEDDPRTLAQRRADAVGAVGAGSSVLACGCDNPDCAARGVDDGRASSVSIHVFAERGSVDGPPDPGLHGQEPPTTAHPWTPPEPETRPAPAPATRLSRAATRLSPPRDPAGPRDRGEPGPSEPAPALSLSLSPARGRVRAAARA